MNKIRLTLAGLAMLLAISVTAQVPQKINYQAIARSATGAVIANQSIGARFTIHDVSPTGPIVYQETNQVCLPINLVYSPMLSDRELW
jgi:cytochrome c5